MKSKSGSRALALTVLESSQLHNTGEGSSSVRIDSESCGVGNNARWFGGHDGPLSNGETLWLSAASVGVLCSVRDAGDDGRSGAEIYRTVAPQ